VLDGHSSGPEQKKPSVYLTQIFTAHTVGALNVSCLMHLKSKLEVQCLGDGKRRAVTMPVWELASLSYHFSTKFLWFSVGEKTIK